MTKLFMLIILCAALTACTAERQIGPASTAPALSSAQPVPSNDTAVVSPVPISIVVATYNPVTLNTASITPSSSQANINVIKEVALQDAVVILYKINRDDYDFFAGIQVGDMFYEIDGIIGYGNPDDVEISHVDFNGSALIKIRGFQGASAPLTHYITIENNIPKSFLLLEKYSEEYDIDLDGQMELVTTVGGTILETEIIKINGNNFESVNLNKFMGGTVVFDHELKHFIVYRSNQDPEFFILDKK